MAIKPVLKMGNTVLSTPAVPVTEFNTQELRQLLTDMHETMVERKGVGIAACQIGSPLNVMMYGFEKSDRYPGEGPIPLTMLINATITALSEETIDGWEGCLSIPGLRGLVPRYKKIQYQGFDEHGNPVSGIAENFHARVMQHEADHLSGRLFPTRINDFTQFGFEEELAQFKVK